jgi:hypothetical protein
LVKAFVALIIVLSFWAQSLVGTQCACINFFERSTIPQLREKSRSFERARSLVNGTKLHTRSDNIDAGAGGRFQKNLRKVTEKGGRAFDVQERALEFLKVP